MAANLQSRSAGRGSRRHAYRPMSEINVTPFVDVMLVLLIVFMVTAPLLTVGVPVDLPKTAAKPLAIDKDPVSVSVTPDGAIFVQKMPVDLPGLVPKLRAIAGQNPDVRIIVRGDATNSYGRMVEVLGAISNAGFSKIGLAAELPGTPSSRAAAARAAKPGR